MGYDPIREKHVTPFDQSQAILPQTPFVEALKPGFTKAGYLTRTPEHLKLY